MPKLVARSISLRSATEERQSLGSRPEVAEYLQVPVSTLAYWAMKGLGPKYVKVGRIARYRWADVDAWLTEQERGTPIDAA